MEKRQRDEGDMAARKRLTPSKAARRGEMLPTQYGWTSKWRILVPLIACLLALAACGGSSTESAKDAYENYAAEEAYDDGEMGDVAMEPTTEAAPSEASGGAASGAGGRANAGFDSSSSLDLTKHKIIRKGSIHLSTEAYDDTIDLIQKAVNSSGGYIEDMQLQGTAPMEAYEEGRSGHVTLRIPAANFDKTLGALRKGGEVTHESISSENVSAKYRDTEAHITSLDTHLASLDALMAKATKLEDMLRLEEEISRLRYEKEGLESNLRNWDDLVGFSTITVNITEINTLAPVLAEPTPEPAPYSFGEEASYNFRSAWNGFVSALKTLALGILAIWPGLLIVAVIAFFLLRYLRKTWRKQEAERKAREAARAEEQARRQTANEAMRAGSAQHEKASQAGEASDASGASAAQKGQGVTAKQPNQVQLGGKTYLRADEVKKKDEDK